MIFFPPRPPGVNPPAVIDVVRARVLVQGLRVLPGDCDGKRSGGVRGPFDHCEH